VTLLNRLRQSEDWLRQLCQGLWKENGVDLQPALHGQAVRLLDATVVKEPGKTGSPWRIDYSLRLPSLECDFLELTPVKGPNSGERLGRFPFHPGELVLADAGYSHPAGVAAVVQQQADICVRLNPLALPLYDEHGEHFPLRQKLRAVERAGETLDWQVWVNAGDQRIGGRICGLRKSEEAIRKAHRKLINKQQRGKGAMTEETQQYACYVLVFTTLMRPSVPARIVLECYRLRWQIELVFKRFKSISQLGHVPKQDDRSSRAWLYGKLFVALLSQSLARIGSAISPWGYYLPQEASDTQPLA
jgi:hypothetical protein